MKNSSYNKMLAEITKAGIGAKVNPVQLVRTNPHAAALFSKLTNDPTKIPTRDGTGKINPAAINPAGFNTVSTDVARNMHETDIIMQMHPDLELAAQILISSVLAPKDMTTVELTFNVENSNLPADLVSTMIEKVRTYMQDTHKIEEELPKILRSVLIDAGSYPVAVIPENSVDDLINNRVGYGFKGGTNVGAESRGFGGGTFKLNTGLLGPRDAATPEAANSNYSAGLESMFSFKSRPGIGDSNEHSVTVGKGIPTGITVIDNPAILHVPKLADQARADMVKRHSRGLGMEDYDTQFAYIKTLQDRVNQHTVFKNQSPDYVPIRPVLTKDKLRRKSIGAPLVMRLPPESTIPVYVPGYPEKHVGYFVMLDNEGNPVMRRKDQDLYYDLGQRLRGSNDLASHLIERVNEGMNGFDMRNRGHIDYAARVYAGMVEEDLISRLKNGLYGRRFAVSENTEVYRMMLARSLKNDHTALLYIPADLLTYFAIRFNEDGTGKSLMQDTRIVNSLRSIVTFANIHAAVRNAISRTKVSVTLDEDDQDPLKTIEQVKGEIMRARAQGMPTGTSNPTDITNWLNTSGYEFEFSGNKGISEMKIDFSESGSSHVVPDTELEQKLRDKSIQGLGLTPEMVDAGFNAEYAASVVANNLLLSKRVIQIQDDFLPHMNHYVRNYLTNSETINFRLKQLIVDNLDRIVKSVPAYKEITFSSEHDKEEFTEYLVESFIESVVAVLPRPNSATLENQLTYLEEFGKALDVSLDNIINTEFLTSDTVGEIEAQVSTIKAIVKAHYMRREIAKIGLLPELAELTTLDEQGRPVVNVYDELSQHVNALTKSMSHFMKGIRPVRDASDTVNEGKDENTGNGFSDDSSNDTGGNGGDDEFGFGGDMNFDMPEDDTPPADGTGDQPAEGGDEVATEDNPDDPMDQNAPAATDEEEPDQS